MSCTNTVRAILRDRPAARYDVDLAYWSHLFDTIRSPERRIRIPTFLRLWQRHRRDFI